MVMFSLLVHVPVVSADIPPAVDAACKRRGLTPELRGRTGGVTAAASTPRRRALPCEPPRLSARHGMLHVHVHVRRLGEDHQPC